MCFSFVGRHSLRRNCLFRFSILSCLLSLYAQIGRFRCHLPTNTEHSLMRMALTLFNRHDSVCVFGCFWPFMSCSYLGSNLCSGHCQPHGSVCAPWNLKQPTREFFIVFETAVSQRLRRTTCDANHFCFSRFLIFFCAIGRSGGFNIQSLLLARCGRSRCNCRRLTIFLEEVKRMRRVVPFQWQINYFANDSCRWY